MLVSIEVTVEMLPIVFCIKKSLVATLNWGYSILLESLRALNLLPGEIELPLE